MASRKGNDNDRYLVPNTGRGGGVVKEDHERTSAQIIDSDTIPRGDESPSRDAK